jgi:hypothetical protein
MNHRFTVRGELDAPLHVVVAAYLDCEHYVHLHRSLTDRVEVVGHEGRTITVRQTWKWLGLKLGHLKSGTYVPPAEFRIDRVRPSPWWFPSIHHLVSIETRLVYAENRERDSTEFVFEVSLDLPFWLYPLRGALQRLIERMHEVQNDEDMALIKRRERLFGRGNAAPYLAEHHFMYHKDDYLRHFGEAARRGAR